MCKKTFGILLLGVVPFFCSCVDDTYDLANKEVSLDMQMKGNKLSLPLGSLRPFILDTLLKNSVDSTMFKTDSETRVYSLSLNDTLITSVASKDLDVLKEVSNLSAEIDPISVDIKEIKFDLPSFNREEPISFQDVKLEDVELEAFNRTVDLDIDPITIDPIQVKEEEIVTSFNMGDVDVDAVDIPGQKQEASFPIDEVKVETLPVQGIEETMTMGIDEIDMSQYEFPTLKTDQSTTLDIAAIEDYLNMGDDYALPASIPLSFSNAETELEGAMEIGFNYPLPQEIKSLNKVELKETGTATKSDKGVLVEFEVKNPPLLSNIKERYVDFSITFPDNYVLSAYDNTYTLKNNTISVNSMKADGETTNIRFYLKEINNLDAESNYKTTDGQRALAIDEEVEYDITYTVAAGSVTIPSGTTVKALKEGLSYAVKLDAAFDISEVYGDINPVESDFEEKELDFSFTIDELDYITGIERVELNPAESRLTFKTTIDDFGKFDIDGESSAIILSLPTAYEFAGTGMQIPDGVAQIEGTNDFRISTVKAFSGEEQWVLPVQAVNFDEENGKVENGILKFSAKAYIKAESNGAEGILTIKEMDDLALMESTQFLCQDRDILFAADPVDLAVTDVMGTTDAIDIPIESKVFNMSYTIPNLEYIKSVDYVEFIDGQTITITSYGGPESGFGKINCTDGSYLALYFPAEYEFDNTNKALQYDAAKGAYYIKIDDINQLQSGEWNLVLSRIHINKEVEEDKTLSLESVLTLEAVNNKGDQDVLYVQNGKNGEFSLNELKPLFGTHEFTFDVNDFTATVEDIQGATDKINVEFTSQEVSHTVELNELEYITYIGNIELKEGCNYFKFRPSLPDLGEFKLAENSVIELNFPTEFVLDEAGSNVPLRGNGVNFVSKNKIEITDLGAFTAEQDWELAVESISLNEAIVDKGFNKAYTISVTGRDADGNEGNLTIAERDNFHLTEIKGTGGECEMTFTMQESMIEIADIEARIDDIDFVFETETFDIPVEIEGLEMIKKIEHITFEEGKNTIDLNIDIVGGSLEPFDLSQGSKVKIALPKGFVLDEEKSNFAGLDYRREESAIYVDNIAALKDCKMTLVVDRINIDKEIGEDGLFNWEEGKITVSAINDKNEADKLYVGCSKEDLKFTEVEGAMGDKQVVFDIPATSLTIDEAVVLSDVVESPIDEEIAINLNEDIPAPIDRVDSLGFKAPVPMTLKIVAEGLDGVDADVNLDLDITLPAAFELSKAADDDKVTINEGKVNVNTKHNFSESNTIELNLWVNRLDFTKLEKGYITLSEGKSDDERTLKYDANAKIDGRVWLANERLSSDLLNNELKMNIEFKGGEVVLNSFAGIYNGKIDPVTEKFELGIEDGFAELEENGLTLTNAKPELSLSLYNNIGVPVDIDLSLTGRDKEGNAIEGSEINPGRLRIKPAQLVNGVLTADTTRWILTSNASTQAPEGYEVIVVEELDNLLEELPYSIDFALTPTIVTENVVHHVDLSNLCLGGRYAISLPFDLGFGESVPLDFGKEADDILRNPENNLTLGNPQLSLAIHNPIAQDLSFDLSIIGKDANDQAIPTASIEFAEPFVLKGGEWNADSTITPAATRWLFAVDESITKEGYETKVAPALSTLLQELPHNIDIQLNAHFNTDLTTQIDYNNDLDLMCEYGVLIPLQFNDLHVTYTDSNSITGIQFDLEELLVDAGMDLAVDNIGLALKMNVKNTLPLGINLNLTPLDKNGNAIKGIKIGTLELPAGNGSSIEHSEGVEATPVELTIECANSSLLSSLDRIAFSLEVVSGNGDNALSGTQGLHISDIVLQVMCDLEMDLTQK